MEVVRGLRAEVLGKTKEVMHNLKEDLEEVVEEALSKRRSSTTIRTTSDGSTLTTVSSETKSSTSWSSGGDAASDTIIDESVNEEGGDAGGDKKQEDDIIYLDKNEDAWKCRECTWTHRNGIRWVDDQMHPKPADFNSGDAEIQSSEFNGKIEDLAANLIGETAATHDEGDESDVEEVVELEFETAVQKMHAHADYNMYCPNCSKQITKVTLRRKIKRKKTEPVRGDLFGCTSCFSIFTSTGNRLNPFRCFGADSGREELIQLQAEQPAPNAAGPTSDPPQAAAAGKGFGLFGFLRGKDGGNAIETPPEPTKEEREHSPATNSQNPGDEAIIKQEEGRGWWIFWKGRVPENGLKSPLLAAASIQSSSTAVTQNPREFDIEKGLGASQPGKDEPSDDTGSSGEASVASQGNILDQTPPQKAPLNGILGTKQPDLQPILNVFNTYNPRPQGGDHVRIPVDIAPPGTDETPQPGVDSQGGASTPVSATQPGSSRSLEIVKSVVYGGLLELIASLSVVSSAAASDATTLNIVVMGLANLVGGLVVLAHNLKDLRYGDSGQTEEEIEVKYKKELGRKDHFPLHAFVAVLSYIIFGLIPPAVYGATFRETNDRDYKMLAVAAASLLGIFLLAIGKAYARREKFTGYSKTVLYYITSAVAASGIAFAVGDLTEKLVEQLGWLEPVHPNSLFQPTWAYSY